MCCRMLLLVISVRVSTIWAELSPDQVSLPAELSSSAERAEIVHKASVGVAQGPGARAEANKPQGPQKDVSGPRPWCWLTLPRHLSGEQATLLVPTIIRTHQV